jgi:hypothetical protein
LKDYVALWLDGRQRPQHRTINAPISVSAKFNEYLVYGFQRVEIELEVEPSSSFEVVDALQRNEEVRENGFLDWAILGLLDVLMVADPEPICNLRVVLKDMDYDHIESSQMAFRMAGRIAGQQIVSALSKDRNSAPPAASEA